MYKKDAKEQLTEEEKDVLETVVNILKEKGNRKIHFFVIEYGAEDREYEGLPQKDYLQAAASHIQKAGIFKKDTDALFVLITKTDKLKLIGAELTQKLKEYVFENYNGFYENLRKIARDCEINNKEVPIMPFTLGQVCFQNYCKIEYSTANRLIKNIIEKAYRNKKGKLNRFFNKLRG